MADIYAFPNGTPIDVRADKGDSRAFDESSENVRQSGLTRPYGVPDVVWQAVLSVQDMPRIKGISYGEIPVPCAMANFGIGVELECRDPDGMPASEFGEGLAGFDPAGAGSAGGWIMVLYSHKFRKDWRSHWRCTAFATLPSPSSEDDVLTPSMYWESMMECLDSDAVEDVSGTVTVTQNTMFGIDGNTPSTGCEIRVSWTPLDYADGGLDAGRQVGMWAGFLHTMTQSEEETPVD